MEDTLILGIETSCDETAAAIVRNGRHILSNVVNSQVDIHSQFGGVVPEIASRKHIENIAPVVEAAFKEADLAHSDIAAIAVTNYPGLIGALLVGLSFAKGFAWAVNRPLLAVNHLHGHIYANLLEQDDIAFPAVCLVASGGHTSLLHMKDVNDYQIIGETRDDAAGEAFDKVARVLKLGYPGGPAIQKAAEKGTPGILKLPRVLLDKNQFEFSFSGLKTAAMNLWKTCDQRDEQMIFNLAAEFQQALVEVLVEKAIKAAEVHKVNSILLAGGVAANQLLRSMMKARAEEKRIGVYYPSLGLCTDNAAMIAGAAYTLYLNQSFAPLGLNAYAAFTS